MYGDFLSDKGCRQTRCCSFLTHHSSPRAGLLDGRRSPYNRPSSSWGQGSHMNTPAGSCVPHPAPPPSSSELPRIVLAMDLLRVRFVHWVVRLLEANDLVEHQISSLQPLTLHIPQGNMSKLKKITYPVE